MENLLFACNAVLPTFLLVLVGAGLRQGGIFDDALMRQGNRLCFQVLFPILVFLNIYTVETVDFSYLKLILIAVGIIVISLAILLPVVPKLVPDCRRRAVLIQSVSRGNYMLYGLPFSKMLGGANSVAMATSIMAVTLPLFNIIGVFVYSGFSGEGRRVSFWDTAVQALKNQILWGVVLGLLFRTVSVPLPTFLLTAAEDMASIATPLAFLLLGGQFHLSSARKNRKALFFGVGAKLVLLPAVVLPVAVFLLGLRGEELVPIFIFAAAPTAITNYQMAIQFHADEELAGDFLIYSMPASVFTMFVFIYGLRSLGWI